MKNQIPEDIDLFQNSEHIIEIQKEYISVYGADAFKKRAFEQCKEFAKTYVDDRQNFCEDAEGFSARQFYNNSYFYAYSYRFGSESSSISYFLDIIFKFFTGSKIEAYPNDVFNNEEKDSAVGQRFLGTEYDLYSELIELNHRETSIFIEKFNTSLSIKNLLKNAILNGDEKEFATLITSNDLKYKQGLFILRGKRFISELANLMQIDLYTDKSSSYHLCENVRNIFGVNAAEEFQKTTKINPEGEILENEIKDISFGIQYFLMILCVFVVFEIENGKLWWYSTMNPFIKIPEDLKTKYKWAYDLCKEKLPQDYSIKDLLSLRMSDIGVPEFEEFREKFIPQEEYNAIDKPFYRDEDNCNDIPESDGDNVETKTEEVLNIDLSEIEIPESDKSVDKAADACFDPYYRISIEDMQKLYKKLINLQYIKHDYNTYVSFLYRTVKNYKPKDFKPQKIEWQGKVELLFGLIDIYFKTSSKRWQKTKDFFCLSTKEEIKTDGVSKVANRYAKRMEEILEKCPD